MNAIKRYYHGHLYFKLLRHEEALGWTGITLGTFTVAGGLYTILVRKEIGEGAAMIGVGVTAFLAGSYADNKAGKKS